MKLARLEKVELRTQWKDEARDFTPWLAEEENITLLGESIGIDLEVIGKEEKVGSFSADILCKDLSTNKYVVIENQLEQTDHSHLGQVITYCAGLEATTFIWISAQVRDEHRAAVDWLNTITDEKYNFFAIEVQLFKIGESLAAPNFKIVAKPNDWSKNVRKQANKDDLSENDLLKLEYWNKYSEFVQKQPNKLFKLQTPQAQTWTSISMGNSKFHISDVIGRLRTMVAVQLNIDGEKAKQYFDSLYEEYYQASQKTLDSEIQWLRLDDKKTSIVEARLLAEYRDKGDWERQFMWLYEMTNTFYKFFKPLVKNMK